MVLAERRPGVVSDTPTLCYLDTGLPVRYPSWENARQGFGPIPTEETQVFPDLDVNKRRLKLGVPQAFKDMYHRGNFEGFGTALAIDIVSTGYLWATIPALTAAMNTAASLTNFELTAAAALAAGGKLTLKSWRKDADALREEHFGTTTIGTIAYGILGKARSAATVDHLINYPLVAAGNPIGIISMLNGDASLLKTDFLATTIALPVWYLGFNSIIARGGFDRILNPIKDKRHAISHEIKHALGKLKDTARIGSKGE